ncbi:VOC family protein [Phenylobacterium sp.]|uniref:VOC family protein n=1 Tax=Phenylobacterium sp. TaxID=1871053 RepID=UPI0011F8D429|nr:VOC family protein [Phenylobacterium sp.]TAL38338.1 MAG: VOC family protein [Phenylobacterium sp.]
MTPGVALDHILFGAPDLEVGVREVTARLGATPAPGGVHPTMGTTNALLSLGGGVYLEVLAPAPGHTELRGFGQQLAGLETPALVNWAARASDLEAVAAAATAAGLAPLGPVPGSRRTESGDLLEWRMLLIGGHDFGTFIPFFIDWGATPHPSITSPTGPRLVRFSVAHPRAAELAGLYRALGLEIEVAEDASPLFNAEIEGAVLTGP